MICYELGNRAVAQYLLAGSGKEKAFKLLPLEKAAVILDGAKLITDVGSEVRFHLGKEE